jgi:hypothetical protein
MKGWGEGGEEARVGEDGREGLGVFRVLGIGE